MDDLISRRAAIDALWKALYEYEDKAEKQFQESEDLDIGDWIEHRHFVQNMNDIDRQIIMQLPSAQPEPKRGKWIYTGIEQNSFYCDKCLYLVKNMSYKFCPNCGAKMEVTR